VRRVLAALAVVLLVLWMPATARQATVCRQPVATLTAPERSYAIVDVREFGGHVFVYVPEIRRTSPTAFAPFDLWIVEGVYGRPFVEPRGSMAEKNFDQLRKSRNVRAQPIRVTRSEAARQMMIRRQGLVVELRVGVARGGADTVTARFCRG
jgi:hypothetical protein